MKVFLVIYAAGQIMSTESPPNMSMVDCEMRVAFLEMEQALILMDEALKQTPEATRNADAVRDLTFACETG